MRRIGLADRYPRSRPHSCAARHGCRPAFGEKFAGRSHPSRFRCFAQTTTHSCMGCGSSGGSGQECRDQYRWAEGRSDRFFDLAAELVRLKVDVIFAGNTSVAVAAKNATGTIPSSWRQVVIRGGARARRKSRAPGRGVTGLSFSGGMETVGKGLQGFSETVRTSAVWQSSQGGQSLPERWRFKT